MKTTNTLPAALLRQFDLPDSQYDPHQSAHDFSDPHQSSHIIKPTHVSSDMTTDAYITFVLRCIDFLKTLVFIGGVTNIILLVIIFHLTSNR
jgi:hypothetical protein